MTLNCPDQVQFYPEPFPTQPNRGGNTRHAIPGPPLGLSKAMTLPVVPAATFVARWCDLKDKSAQSVASLPDTIPLQFFSSDSAWSALEEWLIMDLGLPSSHAVENLICLSVL